MSFTLLAKLLQLPNHKLIATCLADYKVDYAGLTTFEYVNKILEG